MKPGAVAVVAALACLAAAPSAAAADGATAALQVRLRDAGLYRGGIDGLAGPQLDAAVRAFQTRSRLAADGVVGPRTRAALAAIPLGARPLARGSRGFDVAELQFLLAARGFPSGTFGTLFGAGVEKALRKFQRSAGLADDGIAGPATVGALRLPPPRPPLPLDWPLRAPLGDAFGPRGDRWHSGIDLKAGAGAPVGAAAAGVVTWAGELAGGWGLLVAVAHGGGARTLYAHLSRIDVAVGERVSAGARLGLVGSMGAATGPHLHLELRVRGAAIDPLPVLP